MTTELNDLVLKGPYLPQPVVAELCQTHTLPEAREVFERWGEWLNAAISDDRQRQFWLACVSLEI